MDHRDHLLAADITEQNLQQYDAIFLASTTGTFLDDPADAAATAARRKALLDFVRGGRVSPASTRPPTRITARRPRRHRPAAIRRSMAARRSGRSSTTVRRLLQVPLALPDAGRRQDRGRRESRQRAVHVAERDDRRPAAAADLVVDEVYTFNDASWSRHRAHVLTSIDYAKMPAEVRAQEPAPQRSDHDYVLSYLQREGRAASSSRCSATTSRSTGYRPCWPTSWPAAGRARRSAGRRQP